MPISWNEIKSRDQVNTIEGKDEQQISNSILKDLHNSNTRPPASATALQDLGKAVDLCYRPQPFTNETKRIEFLFELYDKYTSGMFKGEKKKKKSKPV